VCVCVYVCVCVCVYVCVCIRTVGGKECARVSCPNNNSQLS